MDEHTLFLEWVWIPVRDAAQEELTRSVAVSSLLQPYLIAQPDKRGEDAFGRVVRALTTALRSPQVEVRLAAAEMLGRAFGILSNWLMRVCNYVPPEIEQAVPDLCVALAENHRALRGHLLGALGTVGRRQPTDQIIQALMLALADPNREIATTAMELLREAGVDAASPAVPALVALLDRQDKVVRHKAIHLLRWLGPDARAAAPALLEIAGPESDAVLRRDAVLALTSIDPQGVVVSGLPFREASRERLLAALRELGPDGRDLRRALEGHSHNHVPAARIVPLGLESVWDDLTHKQREVLTVIWQQSTAGY